MLKEISIEIGSFPYIFSRRIEEGNLLCLRKDHISFLTLQYQDQPEVLFGDEEILEKVKKEFGQNIHADGVVNIHWPDRKVDRIFLSSPESSSAQGKKWLEEVLSRINPTVLRDDVWLSANQKEFYVYHLLPDWYLRNPGIEIRLVIPY